jgi:enamine deaminase RidA (YjgF/YER057c/UK114 family)/ketosteroid isomerase-like protein
MCRTVLVAVLLLVCSLHTQAVPAQTAYNPEARLAELKLTLPPPDAPIGNYVLAVRTGNLLFLAGHAECGDKYLVGKVGGNVTVEQAYSSAKRAGLCILATLKAELGDLRKVKRIVKMLGMVNATFDFKDHPKVIDGCSDLLVAVFGDRGRHARSAVGMPSLADDASVEIEVVVEIDDTQGASGGSTSKSVEASAKAEVRKAQDDLINAYLHRDVGTLDRLLADEYTFVNDDPGGIADKQQILASFGSGGDRTITSYRRQDDRVRFYGDVAVLTYRYQSTETYKGQNSGGDYRVTRILVKRDGHWQMVNGQETKVSLESDY